jgi:NitT/TauT family transport system permease protein
MTVTIVLHDQLLFRPLVAWADKFRFEQTAAAVVPRSWVLDLFRQSRLLSAMGAPVKTGMEALTRSRFSLRRKIRWPHPWSAHQRLGDAAWLALVAATVAYVGWRLAGFARPTLTSNDLAMVSSNGVSHCFESRF